MDKLIVSWEDYNDDIRLLAEEIKYIKNPHLVTLYRGGLPMGTHLSNLLDLPLTLIDFQSYDGKSTNPPEATIIKDAGIKPDDTLVILDDIYDRGNTLNEVNKLLKNPTKFFTMYKNNHNDHLHQKHDFEVTALHLSHGMWVEFPWETA